MTLAVFWQVKNHEFISYDDTDYVTENSHVRGGLTLKGVAWAFTKFHANNWHPLTWLSHMLDVELFGLNAGWHHLMSLFFHIANTVLLFLVLHRMTKSLWQSAFVAALFAIHPLHVESVAWVAERKDVLSTFFWMLTMGAYVFYVEKPETKRYLLALFFFALGLMAKPMLVTLPFVLLLMDYWPLKRFHFGSGDKESPAGDIPPAASIKQKRKSKKQGVEKEKAQAKKPTVSPFQWSVIRLLLWEKVPFFSLTAVASVVTYVAQRGAMSFLEEIPFDFRIANALISYKGYIVKMIWPTNLAVFYPHPGMIRHLDTFIAVLLLSLITFFAVRSAIRFPYVLVGWLWYMGTLVPVIGIVQVGLQGMADRYTYVPLIGLFIMIAWGVPDIFTRRRFPKGVLAVVPVVIISILMMNTWMQIRYWKDSISLYRHALEVTVNNYVMHNNLGSVLEQRGRFKEALYHFTEALRIKKNNSAAHYNMGTVLQNQGKAEEARYHYAEALKINPRFPEVHNNLGVMLFKAGKIDEAVNHYNEAIRINPNHVKTIWDLGNAFLQQGKVKEASLQYARVLQLDPDDSGAHLKLGEIMASQGKFNEAALHFREAVRIKNDDVNAIVGIGNVLAIQGHIDEAIAWYLKAVKIDPANPEIRYDMGTIMASQGNIDEAILHYRAAIRIKPDYAKAHNNLGSALLLQGKKQEALVHFREALRLRPDYKMAQDNLRKAMAQQGKAR